ncbi:hypothetical protein DDZ18_02045 [Marinicauda salina]|uniref:LPS export ABC transporter periplasmic protein LptC n=1 Tax=Marinicauda salina TaxID=2135793 RepID=A0A2U2BWQ0_9PROT|nr:LPS export ABC transporter periplasmic protein LptC [Marinicauda salina]PWE18410.1 hypothetical protein DDZ18_02045 [Marinicauda salina]
MTSATVHHLRSYDAVVANRRARSLEAARRRTRFVRALRGVLVFGLVVVAANAGIQVLRSGLAESRPAPVAVGGEGQRIVNPRFTGRDADGAPFVLTADAAVRRAAGAATLTDLERPALDYQLLGATDEASVVLADAGVYDEAAQQLSLSGDVSLETRSGYRFETATATILLEESAIVGEAPVDGRAEWGAVKAGGFEVRDDGRRIIFRDDVRTRFYVDGAGRPAPEETQP